MTVARWQQKYKRGTKNPQSWSPNSLCSASRLPLRFLDMGPTHGRRQFNNREPWSHSATHRVAAKRTYHRWRSQIRISMELYESTTSPPIYWSTNCLPRIDAPRRHIWAAHTTQISIDDMTPAHNTWSIDAWHRVLCYLTEPLILSLIRSRRWDRHLVWMSCHVPKPPSLV